MISAAAPRTRIADTQRKAGILTRASPAAQLTASNSEQEKKEANLQMKQLKYSISRSKSVSTDDHPIYVPDEDGGIRILTVTAAVVEFFEAGTPAPLTVVSWGQLRNALEGGVV